MFRIVINGKERKIFFCLCFRVSFIQTKNTFQSVAFLHVAMQSTDEKLIADNRCWKNEGWMGIVLMKAASCQFTQVRLLVMPRMKKVGKRRHWIESDFFINRTFVDKNANLFAYFLRHLTLSMSANFLCDEFWTSRISLHSANRDQRDLTRKGWNMGCNHL